MRNLQMAALVFLLTPMSSQAQEVDGSELQGTELMGIHLAGAEFQSSQLQGFLLAQMTLGFIRLNNVQVVGGELVAQGQFRGIELLGALLQGQALDNTTIPPTVRYVVFRIARILAEYPLYDLTGTGLTWLYGLQQWVPSLRTWVQACRQDQDGNAVAIPVAALWNANGDRVESSTMFTLGCTTGVIAKCYRWGYRPWLLNYSSDPSFMKNMHWACTRVARADYCGNGVSQTRDGTLIRPWDTIPPPGPIRAQPLPWPGFFFEAGWNTGGAVCLSRQRWLAADAPQIAARCPNRLIPPGAVYGTATVCDQVQEAWQFDSGVKLFDESQVNVEP